MAPPASNGVGVASVKRVALLGSERGVDDGVITLLAMCGMLAVVVGVGALVVVAGAAVAFVVGDGFCVGGGGKVLAVGRIKGRVGSRLGGSVLAVGRTMGRVGTAVGGCFVRTVVALGSDLVGGTVVATGTKQI